MIPGVDCHFLLSGSQEQEQDQEKSSKIQSEGSNAKRLDTKNVSGCSLQVNQVKLSTYTRADYFEWTKLYNNQRTTLVIFLAF
jgi:hypothetical protein